MAVIFGPAAAAADEVAAEWAKPAAGVKPVAGDGPAEEAAEVRSLQCRFQQDNSEFPAL